MTRAVGVVGEGAAKVSTTMGTASCRETKKGHMERSSGREVPNEADSIDVEGATRDGSGGEMWERMAAAWMTVREQPVG